MGEVILHHKYQLTLYRIRHYDEFISLENEKYLDKRKYRKKPIWITTGIENTLDKDKFTESYGDITKGVEENRVTLVIEEYDNKIAYKLYVFFKARSVGSRHFLTRKKLFYITYNYKTKNVYYGNKISTKRKPLSSRIRVNSFREASLPISFLKDLHIEVNGLKNWNETEDFWTMYDETEEKLRNILMERTGVTVTTPSLLLEDFYYSLFLKHNEIKLPDQYIKFKNAQIPKKQLKKDCNIVKSFMCHYGLKGSKIRDILNHWESLDFRHLIDLYKLLGVDYFNQLKNKSILSSIDIYFTTLIKLSNDEKKYVVLALNSGVGLGTVMDHYRFKRKLASYGLKVKESFVDKNTFSNEHYVWSDLVASYKNGDVLRNYGDNVIDQIEIPISNFVGVEFYPKVLLTTKEYNEESSVQSNCVRTYSERADSIIVSLREGSIDSKSRATVEYRFRKNQLIRFQYLGRYNEKLKIGWDTPLEILDKRLNDLYKNNLLKIPKMTKIYPSQMIQERSSYFPNNPVEIYPVWEGNETSDDEFIEDIGLDFF